MTTKADILKAIRRNCIQCCCGQMREVARCTVTRCDMYPFRFGRDPHPSPPGGAAKLARERSGFRKSDVNDAPLKTKAPACAATQGRREIQITTEQQFDGDRTP